MNGIILIILLILLIIFFISGTIIISYNCVDPICGTYDSWYKNKHINKFKSYKKI